MSARASAAENLPGRAGIAKKAGMKYKILTTRHHDGLSIIQSSLTPYSVADGTPLLTIPSAASPPAGSTSNPSASPLLTPEYS